METNLLATRLSGAYWASRCASTYLQISMGILGLYGSLIAIGVLKSKAGKSSAISNQPAPTAPDYTTRECFRSNRKALPVCSG